MSEHSKTYKARIALVENTAQLVGARPYAEGPDDLERAAVSPPWRVRLDIVHRSVGSWGISRDDFSVDDPKPWMRLLASQELCTVRVTATLDEDLCVRRFVEIVE